MTTRREGDRSLNRRGFLGGAAAACAIAMLGRQAPALATLADDAGAPAPAGKPNSVFNGVHIGTITYSYRGGIDTAEGTLKSLLKDGLSETELTDAPIRAYTDIP